MNLAARHHLRRGLYARTHCHHAPRSAGGENRAYYQIHDYHADILRDSIFETLPDGWRERLVPVPETASAFAHEPHDLAEVKQRVGRRKDLALLRQLISASLLSPDTNRERLALLNLPGEQTSRIDNAFSSITTL